MKNEEIVPIIEDGIYNEEWLKTLKELPSIEQLKRRLVELMAVDKSQMSQQEIRDLFFEKVILFPNNSRQIAAGIFNDVNFWRVRTNVSKNENILLPSTFSYPKHGISNGRANLKSQPVFYCSLALSTSLFESKPCVGDVVYLSKWRICCNKDLSARFLLSDTLHPRNPFFEFYQSSLKELNSTANFFGGNQGEYLTMIERFVANAFVHEVSPYMLTSWLANDIMFGRNGVDILYYPSIACRQISCNIAIVPFVVDNYMRLENVYMVEVIQRDEENIRIGLLEAADLNNNILEWRHPNENDKINLGL